MSFLNTSYARVLTLALLFQAVAFYAVATRTENLPQIGPLSDFPNTVGPWTKVAEHAMEKEIQDVLRADDTLNRTYVNPEMRAQAGLFLAFFKTQRTGQTPHSPKNCLPGSGWEPSATGTIELDVTGQRQNHISINRYIVSRGGDKSVVLYWYQTPHRVIASELSAKIWLVLDAIRYRRSDTALVRATVPVRNGNEEEALRQGIAFIQATYPAIERQLPH